MEITQSPPFLLGRATNYRLHGRVHFPRDEIGVSVAGPGEEFVVFRKMVLDPGPNRPASAGAIFRIRFRFSRFSLAANKRLSLLPAPFIAAQPGFRSKTWMLGRDTGMFQGTYEWDTVADAQSYWDSFPLRMMRRRAQPDSVTYEVEVR